MAEREAEDLVRAVQRVADEVGRFPYQAYLFVFRALGRSQEVAGKPRHVSGQELCEAARQVALELFGPLSLMVLDAWNVRTTQDIGAMVFHLVERGLMGKTDDDKLDDFEDVFDFREAFAAEAALACERPCLSGRERFALADVPLGGRGEVSLG
ncbi:MAG: Minf_1886 family protein [Planctomycetota bacterium]